MLVQRRVRLKPSAMPRMFENQDLEPYEQEVAEHFLCTAETEAINTENV